jgi:hypothetical protein
VRNLHELHEAALDIMWPVVRACAYAASKTAAYRTLTGEVLPHAEGCRGCTIVSAQGSFGTREVEAPLLVIVASGEHAVAALTAKLTELGEPIELVR